MKRQTKLIFIFIISLVGCLSLIGYFFFDDRKFVEEYGVRRCSWREQSVCADWIRETQCSESGLCVGFASCHQWSCLHDRDYFLTKGDKKKGGD